MKTQALVVADDAAYHDWLEKAAPEVQFSLVHADSVEDILDPIAHGERIDVVFFEFSEGSVNDRATLVEALLQRMPDLPVAGLGRSGDSTVMLRAMRAGARDFFVPGQDEDNVTALLRRLVRRQPASAGSHQGTIIGVMAAVPYDGVAFLATHLTLACDELVGDRGRVLLVDVAIPAGASNVFLNLSQSYGVIDAINDGSRCDETLVDTAFTRHSSGVYVLSLPEDCLARPHIDAEDLISLLSVLRGLFSCVVVSYDGLLPMDVLSGLIGLSNKTLMLTDQSILKSRHSKYLLRGLRREGAPLENSELVVDNYRRRIGLEKQNLSELLELSVETLLSTAGDNRIQAMNQGESLFSVAPKDEYCSGVRKLAARLLNMQAVAGASGGGRLLGKLFN